MPYLKHNGQMVVSSGSYLIKTPTIFDDWFLPSFDEFEQIKINLYDEGIGSYNPQYWTSSETSATFATCIDMATGGVVSYAKSVTTPRGRAARTFTAGVGAYALGVVGPAGGNIFYVDGGTTYYEAASADTDIASSTWSNISTLIGTTLEAIGEGQNNTDEIIAQIGFTAGVAKVCDDLVVISYK